MTKEEKKPDDVTRWHVVWTRFRKRHKDKDFATKLEAAEYLTKKFGGGKEPCDFKYTPISLGDGNPDLVVEYYGAIIAVIISKTNGEEY